jgi:phosphoribosyl 1,2-cyclic phosphate phosphodiesterase
VGAAVETDGGAVILIDTPTELRLQLLAAHITRVDAVLYTHLHADHTHGIDDLRAITARRDAHLPMYGAADTLAGLEQKFNYIFDDNIRPLPGTSKPRGRTIPLAPGVPTRIADVDVTAVAVPHGPVTIYAYRIGPLAYVTDANAVPDSAVELLRGARVLVINALFRTPHPSHLSFPEAIAAARAIGAERTYLTHLTHDNFHAALELELPTGIAPAYDGLSITV